MRYWELNRCGGVYKITCKANDAVYIGSSKNLRSRGQQHKQALILNKHTNKAMQNDWNKYGEFNFSIEMIEMCGERDARILEQKYIDYYLSTGVTIYNRSLRVPSRKEDTEKMAAVYLDHLMKIHDADYNVITDKPCFPELPFTIDDTRRIEAELVSRHYIKVMNEGPFRIIWILRYNKNVIKRHGKKTRRSKRAIWKR